MDSLTLRKQFQQHDVHLVDGLLLRIKQLSQFTIFGLNHLNLFNDLGQVGVGHDVVHDPVYKFGIRQELRFC